MLDPFTLGVIVVFMFAESVEISIQMDAVNGVRVKSKEPNSISKNQHLTHVVDYETEDHVNSTCTHVTQLWFLKMKMAHYYLFFVTKCKMIEEIVVIVGFVSISTQRTQFSIHSNHLEKQRVMTAWNACVVINR